MAHWKPLMASPLGVAMALFALIFSLAGAGHFATSPRAQATGTALLASAAISNQQAPAYLTGALHSERNTWFKSWTVTTFGMDNGLHSHSSNTSFLVWKTNFYRP